jgi:hypothetical protein
LVYHPLQNSSSNGKESDLSSKTCVVYLHGRGGNRTEALWIARALPPTHCLLLMDLSSCGYSQGKLSTCGLKESYDIGTPFRI